MIKNLRTFASRLAHAALARILPGKTERRLALVILVTTMAPLAVALYLATSMFRQAAAIWFNPEIGKQLDQGVDVYKDYVKAVKDDLRHQTVAIAADPVIREAARKRNIETLESELDAVFTSFPELVTLRVEDPDGVVLAARDRGRPVDDAQERSLEVRRSVGVERKEAPPDRRGAPGDEAEAPVVVATFAVARKRLDELETAGGVVARYHQLETSRAELYEGYLNAFAALLGVTMVVTLVLGIALARGVTRRINRLGAAIDLVARGDLSVRVPVTGSDELTNLARTFNRMLGEMAQSRTRIEFLQRVGAWQDMAQRLAHEIKNPLTPIRLAVQEAHEKYTGGDPRYRQLLDTTLEIVEEEVGTLGRLVGNFSNFARLPTAELAEANLADFLRDCENQLGHLEDPSLGEASADAEPLRAPNVAITWEHPSEPLRVALDRQMLRRVIVNLVRNAVQAIRDAHARPSSRPSERRVRPATDDEGVLGHVVVSARRDGDGARIEIEDDGPGIPEPMRGRVFDPYFTTKADGTGLGLAIVKKVIVEHGGEIEAGRSERLGGARFVVRLPGLKILAIAAEAREARERAKKEGIETLAT